MSTPEELFDVVDENDDVIATMPRREVHRLQLRHRAVHVFVFRPDGRLLIHRRADDKEEFPGVWTSSASGHVSASESYDDAAPRELAEELGVHGPLHRCQKFEACEDTCREFTVLYEFMTSQVIRHDPQEIAEIRWATLDEISAWIVRAPEDFSPAFQLLFNWYVRRDD